jgi:hypothetical protein
LEPGPGAAWIDAQIGEASRRVFATLAEGGARALFGMRLQVEQCDRLLTTTGRTRATMSPTGNAPRAHEPRWATMRAFAGTSVVGWCARGVRVAEPDGPEGFAERALMVDRLLVVGREEGGTWGMWVEGLVLTRDGWRILPWVTWGDAVERPRRDHTDVALWDCDRSSGPAPR